MNEYTNLLPNSVLEQMCWILSLLTKYAQDLNLNEENQNIAIRIANHGLMQEKCALDSIRTFSKIGCHNENQI